VDYVLVFKERLFSQKLKGTPPMNGAFQDRKHINESENHHSLTTQA